MDFPSLINGLDNNTISVLSFEHSTYPELSETKSVLDKAKHWYEHAQACLAECRARTFRPIKDRNGKDAEYDSMIEFYQRELRIKYGERINHIEASCYQCDQSIALIPLDETTIAYITNDLWLEQIRKVHYKALSKKDVEHSCVAVPLMKQKKMVAQITVATGELVFDNFFRNEELYDLPKSEKYSRPSINSILGRNRLMQHLATKNVGCCHMGNMSVTIFLKNDGTKIIIGNEYKYTDHREKKITHNGYKKLGSITLDVWRWMCADKSVLDQYNEKIGSRLPYAKPIIANVKKGRWQIEHYYDFDQDEEIYSTLSLIQ